MTEWEYFQAVIVVTVICVIGFICVVGYRNRHRH
jgi:hypothetical protein